MGIFRVAGSNPAKHIFQRITMKRLSPSSARVPLEPGLLASSNKNQGATRVGDDSSQQDDFDDEDEAEREVAWLNGSPPSGFFSLFIDGISDLVGCP